MNTNEDVVIIGTGVAGLYCALNLPEDKSIRLITKSSLDMSDSYLAQGGICVLKEQKDYDSFFQDTIKAGHYENNRDSVHQMIQKSPEIIRDLISLGVEFEQKDGNLLYTKEGAHSTARILYHKDITGQEITSKLLEQVKKKKNIIIMENTEMIDLICHNNCCSGVIVRSEDGVISRLNANYTVLATGGVGGLFHDSTNYPHLTGDSLALAIKHNIKLKNINYIQIHPTTLFSMEPGKRYLISESVRGEGAYLLNAHKERFVDELLPRDVLTQKIYQQMKSECSEHVWLSVTHLGKDKIKNRFPNIYERCLEDGIDITLECIPVVPAQHYFMGGIDVNLQSKTSMEHLYAVGETSCNGVHGANRLASNSLLESLVFAREAAVHIASTFEKNNPIQPAMNFSIYENYEQLQKNNKKLILQKWIGSTIMNNEITFRLNVDNILLQALREDITNEDITTNAVIRENKKGQAQLLCKQNGVIAGMDTFYRVFFLLDPCAKMQAYVKDGDKVNNGDLLAVITADVKALLSGERTALNYLQRMSGIASYTRMISDMLKGSKTKLLDTRKTTPNMRIFEKYAVKVGGGCNHRFNLSDGILIKDNHIAAAGGVKKAIELARKYAPFVRKIEVEVENLEMLKEALEAGPDIIMLDNMSTEMMHQAVAMIGSKAETECSGNVTKERIAELMEIGVDYISCGALTHSAPVLDVSLKNLILLAPSMPSA